MNIVAMMDAMTSGREVNVDGAMRGKFSRVFLASGR
jgi:hypothetical protein